MVTVNDLLSAFSRLDATPTRPEPSPAVGSRKEGADPIYNGSHREVQLPLPLPPPPPSPSPALRPSALRRRKDGRPVTVQAASHQAPPRPYGSSPATHPDTGEPLAGTAAPRRKGRPAWATGAPERARLPLTGDDAAKPARAAALAARLSAYVAA